MADPTTEPKPTAESPPPAWMNLAVNVLSLLEKILPAFLVAWNNALQQKNKELSLRLDKAALDAKVVAFNDSEKTKDMGKSSTQVVDDFLGRGPSDGPSAK